MSTEGGLPSYSMGQNRVESGLSHNNVAYNGLVQQFKPQTSNGYPLTSF